MGLASSQARLLSITARLTSNEYESQQISNAKMRLATQSQEASEAYIAALNETQYSFISFDSTGNSVQTPLTVLSLYEYADGKNQYILTNSAGKVLLNNTDINNYEKSANLEEFLSKYGVTRSYKSKELQRAHDAIYGGDSPLIEYKKAWDKLVDEYSDVYSSNAWAEEKVAAQNEYMNNLIAYNATADKKAMGSDIDNTVLTEMQTTMEESLKVFQKLVTYTSAKESKIIDSGEHDEDYNNYMKYQEEVTKYQVELEKLNINPNEAFEYDDVSKAQWYTNLWYKINGSSTDKSGLNNYASFVAKDGISEHLNGLKDENKIPDNDTKILNSSVWISNALSKGLVNIEQASYKKDELKLANSDNPLSFTLQGITWKGKIYSSISEIVQSDNDKKIAQAEAEYQRKTAEINAKDEKYQRKISLLDSEHNAMQTEYESVKSAMNKNAERSFKAFQG